MKNTRRCKVCKLQFTPLFSSMRPVCTNAECITTYYKQNKEKIDKKHSQQVIKEMRERSMSASDWRKSLQQVFNTFIRLRDKGKLCVSCDRPLNAKYDAGHYFSVGSYPNLRFNEDNCHRQCGFNCNTSKHGNTALYAKNLILKIGTDRFDKLFEDAKVELKLSIPELQEKIKFYKDKIKQLTASNNVGEPSYPVKFQN